MQGFLEQKASFSQEPATPEGAMGLHGWLAVVRVFPAGMLGGMHEEIRGGFQKHEQNQLCGTPAHHGSQDDGQVHGDDPGVGEEHQGADVRPSGQILL